MHRRSVIKLGTLAAAFGTTPLLTVQAHSALQSEPPAAIMMAGSDAAWSNHHPGPAPNGQLADPAFLDTGEAPIHGFQSTLLATTNQVIAFGTFPDDVLAFDRTTGDLLWRTQSSLRIDQAVAPAFMGNSVFVVSGDPDAPGDEAIAPFHLSAIDLATGDATAWTDTFGGSFASRLVVASSTLLAAGPTGIVAFDIESGTTAWHHELDGAPDVHALLAVDSQVIAGWAGEASYQMTLLDLATGETGFQQPIDGSLAGLGEADLLVLGRDRLIGYGVVDGVETWSISLPIEAPHTLAFDAQGFLVANQEAIVSLDPATGDVTWQATPGVEDPSGFGLTISGSRVAIGGDPNGRWLDRATGETLQELASAPAEQSISLRGVAIIDGLVWGATSAGIIRWEVAG